MLSSSARRLATAPSPWRASNNWSMHQAAFERERRQQRAAEVREMEQKLARQEQMKWHASLAALERVSRPHHKEATSFRMGNNYALHSAHFEVQPERRLTRAEAWEAARMSPLKAAKAVKEAVVGITTFLGCTIGWFRSHMHSLMTPTFAFLLCCDPHFSNADAGHHGGRIHD